MCNLHNKSCLKHLIFQPQLLGSHPKNGQISYFMYCIKTVGEGGHIHCNVQYWTRDHKGGCEKRPDTRCRWVWGVSGGDIRRSKEGEREGREDTSEGETSRFVPPAQGSAATYSQPAPAVRGGRAGLALSLLMQVIFLTYFACLGSSGLGDDPAALVVTLPVH